MRRAIIESLTYPRMMMLSQMDSEDCPMHLYFDPTVPTCRICEQSQECRWLNSHDEFAVLAEQPIQHLYQAVLFCIDYVESQSSLNKHNFRRCPCESCVWLRDARYLTRQIEQESDIS